MSIIVDYNAIAISALHSKAAIKDGKVSEVFLRHLILNSLKGFNSKFRDKYGKMIIAADSTSWRKTYFPNYKAARRKGREESDLDWGEIFTMLNTFFDEIAENIPWACIKIDGAEGDDIIGVLAKHHKEPTMIVSNDKDMLQLQKYPHVKQFAPMKGKLISENKPKDYLQEHVLRGDAGDGVPNILSNDDVFIREDLRQVPLKKTKVADFMDRWSNLEKAMDENTYRNFIRNRKLIDLDYIPETLVKEILLAYKNVKIAPNMKVLNYLIKKKCKNLIGFIDQFFPPKKQANTLF